MIMKEGKNRQTDQEPPKTRLVHFQKCVFMFVWFFFVSSPSVPAGGENGSEAAAGVCGVLRVQRAAAHTGHHLRGHQERYNHVYVLPLILISVCLNAEEIDES